MPEQDSNDSPKPNTSSPKPDTSSANREDAIKTAKNIFGRIRDFAKDRADTKAEKLNLRDNVAFAPVEKLSDVPGALKQRTLRNIEKGMFEQFGIVGEAAFRARRVNYGEKWKEVGAVLGTHFMGAIGGRGVIGEYFANKIGRRVHFSDTPQQMGDNLQTTQEAVDVEFHKIQERFVAVERDYNRLKDSIEELKKSVSGSSDNTSLKKSIDDLKVNFKSLENKVDRRTKKSDDLYDFVKKSAPRWEKRFDRVDTKLNELDSRVRLLEQKNNSDGGQGKSYDPFEGTDLELDKPEPLKGRRFPRPKGLMNKIKRGASGVVSKAIGKVMPPGLSTIGQGLASGFGALGSIASAGRLAALIPSAGTALAIGGAGLAGVAALALTATAAKASQGGSGLDKLEKKFSPEELEQRKIPKGKVDRRDWERQLFGDKDESPTSPNKPGMSPALGPIRTYNNRYAPQNQLDFSTLYQREQIDDAKKQFMMFGKLPGGFEFSPGYMGRLGMPANVAAGGAQPLFGGSGYEGSGGYGGGSGGSYGGSRGGSYFPSERGIGPQPGTPVNPQAIPNPNIWQGGTAPSGPNDRRNNQIEPLASGATDPSIYSAYPDSAKVSDRGQVDQQEFYNMTVKQFANSKLNGYVPKDGAKYGIDGSPESWAKFAMRVAKPESGFNTRNSNTSDPGGSYGLYQWGMGQWGINQQNWTDPKAQNEALVKYADKWVIQGGGYINPDQSIQGVRRYNGRGGFAAAFSTVNNNKIEERGNYETANRLAANAPKVERPLNPDAQYIPPKLGLFSQDALSKKGDGTPILPGTPSSVIPNDVQLPGGDTAQKNAQPFGGVITHTTPLSLEQLRKGKDPRGPTYGYHVAITPDGQTYELRSDDKRPNQMKPASDPERTGALHLQNENAFGIVYTGGRGQMTEASRQATINHLSDLVKRGVLPRDYGKEQPAYGHGEVQPGTERGKLGPLLGGKATPEGSNSADFIRNNWAEILKKADSEPVKAMSATSIPTPSNPLNDPENPGLALHLKERGKLMDVPSKGTPDKMAFSFTTEKPFSKEEIDRNIQDSKLPASQNMFGLDLQRDSSGKPKSEGAWAAKQFVKDAGAKYSIYHQGPGFPGFAGESPVGWKENLRATMLENKDAHAVEADNTNDMKPQEYANWLAGEIKWQKDNGLKIKYIQKNMSPEYEAAMAAHPGVDKDYIHKQHKIIEGDVFKGKSLEEMKGTFPGAASVVTNNTHHYEQRKPVIGEGLPTSTTNDFRSQVQPSSPIPSTNQESFGFNKSLIPEQFGFKKPETLDISRVSQSQGKVADIRRQKISDKLSNVLSYAAEKAGVFVDVTSGGQAPIGSGGPRTGSTRHDNGMAGDVDLYVMEDGKKRKLDMMNPKDRPLMMDFVKHARSAGATGIGAGIEYMGRSKIHVGFGDEATWGSAKAGWLGQAFAAGQQNQVDISKFVPQMKRVTEEEKSKNIISTDVDLLNRVAPKQTLQERSIISRARQIAGVEENKTDITKTSATKIPSSELDQPDQPKPNQTSVPDDNQQAPTPAPSQFESSSNGGFTAEEIAGAQPQAGPSFNAPGGVPSVPQNVPAPSPERPAISEPAREIANTGGETRDFTNALSGDEEPRGASPSAADATGRGMPTGGGAYHPEEEPAKPGSGAYGSGGRCFVALFCISIGLSSIFLERSYIDTVPSAITIQQTHQSLPMSIDQRLSRETSYLATLSRWKEHI